MKLNRIITLSALAAVMAVGSNTSLFAQPGGGGGPGGGRNRGNFDPAQMQQLMLQRAQDNLGITDDKEWDAVKPLVQKVMDARRDLGGAQMRGMMGGRNRGGGQGNQGGPGGPGGPGGMFQPSPEMQALQKAVDDNAPAAQIKDLLAKYQASQKVKADKLAAAQANLRAVLSVKQEAAATLLGLL